MSRYPIGAVDWSYVRQTLSLTSYINFKHNTPEITNQQNQSVEPEFVIKWLSGAAVKIFRNDHFLCCYSAIGVNQNFL